MHLTSGAVSRFKFENVRVPEQPLKLYSTVIDVTFSSGDIVKLIVLPCEVVPLQWPARPAGVGAALPPHPVARAQTAAVTNVLRRGTIISSQLSAKQK